MKVKLKIMLCVCCVLLCSAFCVNAEEAGYIVKFKSGYMPDSTVYNLREICAERGLYCTADADSLKNIEKYIEYIEPNVTVELIGGEAEPEPFMLSADEYYSEQTQIQLINTEYLWKYETYGNDVRVAVIDSGCNAHDELKDNLLEGRNYNDYTSDVTDNDVDSKGELRNHGTHVSGIIAAKMDTVGITGVAPKAKIVPLKCFDPSFDTDIGMLAAAIYDAVDDFDCKVISMSWGVNFDSATLKTAVDYAYTQGAVLVAAVGNDGNNTLRYPAAYAEVIGVGSVTINKVKSSFSNYNASVTVVAPGEYVKSLHGTKEYKSLKGTSQATPMVSGFAAAALAAKPDLTNAEFYQLLISTAENLGDDADNGQNGYDVKYGYGLIDGRALMNKLMESMDYYVSPVNTTETETYVFVRNNTDTELNAISLLAEYDDGIVLNVKRTPLKLLAGENATIRKETAGGESTAHFLWNNEAELAPVANRR